MEIISTINAAVNNIVWGPIMLTLLIGVGLFLSIKTNFMQFRKFGYMMKNTILGMFSKSQHKKDDSGVSPFQAVATAMAGTIGTGSIAGLATAIVSGGPGAVFWMWISALLGMVTKYSEIVLSLKYREQNKDGKWVGGPMYYIKNGLNIKWLAALFAIFAMLACLGTGNATQSNSIAVALESTLGVNPYIIGAAQGSALSIASFDAIFPKVGGIIVTLSTVFFALSTILGWAYYGEVSIEYLFNNSKIAVRIYRCCYIVFVFLGAVGSLDLIWSISETMNGLMAIPNLIGIIGLSKVIKTATAEHFDKLK